MDGWDGMWGYGNCCEYGIELKHGLDFLDILYIPFFYSSEGRRRFIGILLTSSGIRFENS